ncbi:MAG: heavy-metal-associated domain-containing protein [Bacteroidales bacterium]|nr:heavy-metal-associated domain-containing protein [Bacteroidales bacterium]
MNTIKFKSNLKCSGCVDAIQDFMNSIPEVNTWVVDLDSPDRLIKVTTIENPDDNFVKIILEGITAIGYNIELI